MKDKPIEKIQVKPFLKWAGGKSQLIPQLSEYYPTKDLATGSYAFIEPFIGGGAVFFDLINKFEFVSTEIKDINPDLIITYLAIRDNLDSLINELQKLSKQYEKCKNSVDPEGASAFYYEVRRKFNKSNDERSGQDKYKNIQRAAQLIFLNRTCFNGLFRVNKSGEFNVPFGRYKNPQILNKSNLEAVSSVLKDTTISNADFKELTNEIPSKSFVYFDPPYRPLHATSAFTAYVQNGFTDDDQIALADVYKSLHKKGCLLMLSNSDPKNFDENDNFFDVLYKGFKIRRLLASRMINRNVSGRGKISEILVTNY